MKQKVYEVISRTLRIAVDQINDETSPDDVKEWDSLRHLSLMLALEEEFQTQFSPDQIGEMQTVGIIVLTLKELGCQVA